MLEGPWINNKIYLNQTSYMIQERPEERPEALVSVGKLNIIMENGLYFQFYGIFGNLTDGIGNGQVRQSK